MDAQVYCPEKVSIMHLKVVDDYND